MIQMLLSDLLSVEFFFLFFFFLSAHDGSLVAAHTRLSLSFFFIPSIPASIIPCSLLSTAAILKQNKDPSLYVWSVQLIKVQHLKPQHVRLNREERNWPSLGSLWYFYTSGESLFISAQWRLSDSLLPHAGFNQPWNRSDTSLERAGIDIHCCSCSHFNRQHATC